MTVGKNHKNRFTIDTVQGFSGYWLNDNHRDVNLGRYKTEDEARTALHKLKYNYLG